jgi:hypothetical protein
MDMDTGGTAVEPKLLFAKSSLLTTSGMVEGIMPGEGNLFEAVATDPASGGIYGLLELNLNTFPEVYSLLNIDGRG